jgi:hypothetical protein
MACAVAMLAVCAAVGHAPAADRGPKVVSAIREMLQLSVERGQAAIGRPDGFAGNPSIRLSIPESLAKVESLLRLAGEERRVERFEASLNHAAEYSAPAARAPLLAAIIDLPLDDGHRALMGGETAATDALRRHALGRVITALNPAVAAATDRAGTGRRYKRFMKDAHFGGLVQGTPPDLDAYIVGKTVEGIFHAIGKEERRIRVDPAARPTSLLREVFRTQR